MCAGVKQDVNEMLTSGPARNGTKVDLVRDALDLIDRIVLAADR